MSKKMKLLTVVFCVIMLACVGVLGSTLYTVQVQLADANKKIQEINTKYEKINDKYNEVNDKYKKAKSEIKISKEESKFARALAQEYKNALESQEDTINTDETTIPEPASDPEPVVTATPTPEANMNILGTYTEPGSGRVQITITPHDASAPYDYLVNIQGSNGATDNSSWSLVGDWDADSNSVIYNGVRMDNVNGVSTSYDGQTGSLRFENESTLYWTDAGTGNYDRGPFTKN